MRVIFSKDRAAQLDLLLRSLDRYAPDDPPHVVLWYATSRQFTDGYLRIFNELTADDAESSMTTPDAFDRHLRRSLRDDDTVTFFCDDDVVFRVIPIPDDTREYLTDERVLTFSWRLSALLADRPWWYWATQPRTDHGYPGSIDGHTFRTADVLEMIGNTVIANPTMLETALAAGCENFADRRPLMAAWPEQVLVGVPVNRVSDPSGCPFGEVYPQPVEELNERFLAGERIALDRLDFSGVHGCHHEFQYEWEPA